MSFVLTPKDNGDINDLLNWLERCPSRHRHLLACLGGDLYIDLCKVESAAKTLAEQVTTAAKPRGFIRKK